MAKTTKTSQTVASVAAKADAAKTSIFDMAGKAAANPGVRNVGKGVALGFGATLGYIGAVTLYKAVAV